MGFSNVQASAAKYANYIEMWIILKLHFWNFSWITFYTINVVYYLKCNMRHKTAIYNGKIRDISLGFKSRINQHILESRDGILKL